MGEGTQFPANALMPCNLSRAHRSSVAVTWTINHTGIEDMRIIPAKLSENDNDTE